MNQKGFANLILIAIVAILVGLGGYFVWKNNDKLLSRQNTPKVGESITLEGTISAVRKDQGVFNMEYGSKFVEVIVSSSTKISYKDNNQVNINDLVENSFVKVMGKVVPYAPDMSNTIFLDAYEVLIEQSPTFTQTTNWKTYRNEKYGFEVKYPAEWIAESALTGVVTFTSRGGSKIGVFSQGYNVGDIGTPACTSVSVSIASHPAKRVECRNQAGKVFIEVRFDPSIPKQENFAIIFDPRSDQAEALKTFNQILSTFKFISSTSSVQVVPTTTVNQLPVKSQSSCGLNLEITGGQFSPRTCDFEIVSGGPLCEGAVGCKPDYVISLRDESAGFNTISSVTLFNFKEYKKGTYKFDVASGVADFKGYLLDKGAVVRNLLSGSVTLDPWDTTGQVGMVHVSFDVSFASNIHVQGSGVLEEKYINAP